MDSAPRIVWLHLAIGIVAGLTAGAGVLASTTPVYASSTSVLVESMGAEVNLGTEAELVGATQTAADAFARLTGDPSRPPATGTLAGVEPLPGTSVLVITFEAESPTVARDGATAFAEAYLAARGQAARSALDEQIAGTQTRLDEVRTQLGGVTMLIAQLPSDAAELESLRASQEALAAEAATLTARLRELRTTTVIPGRVVAEAPLPTGPVRPHYLLWLGVAATGGALAGLVLHLVRTRWSRRVRRGGDLRRHRAVPILTELDAATLVAAGWRAERGSRGRELGTERANRSGGVGTSARRPDGPVNRLRNEIIAALTPDDRVVLVTGAAPGSASTVVAASLAAAFARADCDVVLVGASTADLDVHPRARPTLAGIFDLADIPGLSDVLAGRTTLARSVQRVASQPRLRVITPGGTVSATGLLQSEGARSVLRQLAARTRYVIVDAPSTAAGADAQSLAGAADATLLVVELDRAGHAQVADAATQFARVGTRLLGAVVVPRMIGPRRRQPVDRIGPAPAVRRPAAGPAGDPTDAWISARSVALDGPTRKLDAVNRNPRAWGRDGPAAGPRDPAAADRTAETTDAADGTATDRTVPPAAPSSAP